MNVVFLKIKTVFSHHRKKIIVIGSITLALCILLFITPEFPLFSGLSFLQSPFFLSPWFWRIDILTSFLVFAVLLLAVMFSPSPWPENLKSFLFAVLPAALIFTVAYSQNDEYATFLKVAITFFYFICALFFIRLYVKDTYHFYSEGTLKNSFSFRAFKRKKLGKIFFVVLFLNSIFLVAGLYHLGKFSAVDEALWLYGRIPRYFSNIADGEFHKTDVSDKPGITVPLTTGVTLFFIDPFEYEPDEGIRQFQVAAPDMAKFFFAFRFPLLLFVFFSLFILFALTRKLFGLRIALLNQTFIATSPILIGMAKIINPDSLLWIFSTLALLSFLVYQKNRRFFFLLLTGVFFGLALLTKYVANILLVFFFLYVVLEFILRTPKKDELRAFWKHHLATIGIIFFGAMVTFYVLLPAAWIEPSILLESTFFSQAFEKFAWFFLVLVALLLLEITANKSRILVLLLPLMRWLRLPVFFFLLAIFYGSLLFVFVHVFFGLGYYNFPALLSSPKTIGLSTNGFGILFSNFYVLAFSQLPLVLLGTVLSLVAFCFYGRNFLKKQFLISQEVLVVLFLLGCILLYYLGSVLSGVASIVRYQVILYPVAILLSAWSFLVIIRRLPEPRQKTAFLGVLFLALITGVFTLTRTPFPQSYASSLLPTNLYTDVKDMGPGSYEAAQYLNSLPRAEEITIWSDKSGVCIFFVGKCVNSTGKDTLSNPFINYVVVSTTRQSRVTKMSAGTLKGHPELLPLPSFYSRNDAAYTVKINGRESHTVKIFLYRPLGDETQETKDEYYLKIKQDKERAKEEKEEEE